MPDVKDVPGLKVPDINKMKHLQAAFGSVGAGERNGMNRVFVILHGGDVPDGTAVTHAMTWKEVDQFIAGLSNAREMLKRKEN